LHRHHDGEADLVLHSCPFETTALADPDTVCDLLLPAVVRVEQASTGTHRNSSAL
jgi:predicted ArsR family transcriptional regulator